MICMPVPSMMAVDSDFDICTYNCNGINDNKKRKDVFDFLRQQKCNIYFLQETHLKYDDESFIRSCWGYDIWLAGSESNKNGVAILFNNNFEYKLHNIIRDPDGCFIIMDVELLKKRVTLVNLYGPSAGDKPQYFDRISEHIEQIENRLVIAAGDWNVVLNMQLDCRNYRSNTNKPQTRKKIFDLMEKHDLVDVFREIYPDKHKFTWRKFNSTKQGRLDYFLVTEELMPEVKGAGVGSRYRSDHSVVSISLKTNAFKRDKPFWKFNNSLLRDKVYIDEIKKLILRIKKQYALHVYNINNFDRILDEEIQFQISDQLFFETLLMEIRGKTISYASFKKKQETLLEHNLVKEIQYLEDNIDQSLLSLIEDRKSQLQEIRNRRLEGMIIRSRVRWLQEGEKVSRYFCNLENRNFCSKSLGFLERGDGSTIFEQKEILEEVKCFFTDLYSHRDIAEVDLTEVLTDTPVLTNEDSESIEGLLTYAEAHTALKNMKNNKSPGPDGFSVEFYKFFFSDIGTFLVRSINGGFQNEELSVTQKQGVITCIPKDGKPKQHVKNWRPNSLLNTS